MMLPTATAWCLCKKAKRTGGSLMHVRSDLQAAYEVWKTKVYQVNVRRPISLLHERVTSVSLHHAP